MTDVVQRISGEQAEVVKWLDENEKGTSDEIASSVDKNSGRVRQILVDLTRMGLLVRSTERVNGRRRFVYSSDISVCDCCGGSGWELR